MPRKVLVADL